MEIKKVTQTPQEIKEFAGEYPAELDPVDVVEIFQTPLTGSYNWDYTVVDDRIKKLYELGKKLNWNVETDIDWDRPYEGVNSEELDRQNLEWCKHPQYIKWDSAKRKQFLLDTTSWTISQYLHGEQGALLVASQLSSCAPTFNAKLYAASQTFDEARHVEAFNKYLQTRLKKIWPVTRSLKGLLDKILTDPRWDIKFIGMQVVIEGLALAGFNAAKQTTKDPVLRDMLELILRDEARHVAFGVNYLRDYIQTLTEEEKRDRALFALEACTVFRNRPAPVDVWSKYNLDIEYTRLYAKENFSSIQFQDILFTRIMPSLNKLGLLSSDLLSQYADLGILGYADGDSDFETSWEELSKPLF